MATAEYDSSADDVESANKLAIQLIEKCFEQKVQGVIPPGPYKFILKQLNRSESNSAKIPTMSYLHDFHKKIGEGIVQVDATFEINVDNKIKQFPAGGDWRIRITIDADTPPPPPLSTQGKHIGFEVDFKGIPKVAGHIWCDAVPRGRPGMGVSMRENTITDCETTKLPNGDQVIFSLKTYSI